MFLFKNLENKLSQRLLAANVDLEERHLRRIEKGRTNPTLGTLYDIAIELDVSLEELLP